MPNVQPIAVKAGVYANAEVIMREAGKGSRARPFSVDQQTFDKNWDAIFKRPDPRVVQDQQNEDEAWAEIEKKQNNQGNKNASENK
jgi:hypothetical protein